MLDPHFVFVAFGTVAGATATVVIAGLQSPRRWCPQCGTILPQFRIPRSIGEAWRRGWTCSGCAAQMDRDGRAIDVVQQVAVRPKG